MQKNVILVSPFSIWMEHSSFDIGFIQTFLDLSYTVKFFWEKAHCELIAEFFKWNNLVSLQSFSENNKVFLWWKIILNVFLCRENKPMVFLSFDHPHILFFVWIFFRNTIGISHYLWGKWYFPWFIKKLWLWLYSLRNRIVVLGPWILKDSALLKIDWIFHPIIQANKSGYIKFGKRLFFTKQETYKMQDAFDLSFIREKSINNWYYVLKTEKNLSINDYLKRLEYCQYMIILSSPDAYKNRCSGSLFDAISRGLPVLWIKSPMFESLQQEFWFFGYFFNNTKELSNFLLFSDSFNTKRVNSKKIEQIVINHNTKKFIELIKTTWY